MLPPKVIMKPDTNLSRRSSIFYCNRHQIDRTSMINFCATTQKHLGNFEEKNRRLYFSNGPSGPAGGTETIKKGSPYLYMFQKWGKRHDTSFITSILKSLVILVIWLGLIGALYIQKAPFFFSKLNLSPTHWNWKTAFAALWRPAHYWIKKAFLQTKMSCIWRPKFCHFKMDVIKWCLNSCLVPHTSLILKSLICAYDFRPNNSDLWSGEIRKVLTFVWSFWIYSPFSDLCDCTVTMHHPTKIISYCSIGWLGIFTGKFSGEDVFD